MPFLDFRTLSLWTNLVIFAGAAVLVWSAGTRGMLVTCAYLLGLLERRNRTVLRMGVDSFGVLVAYGVGLYFLRS